MLEAVSEKWEELVSLQNQASFSLFLQIYSSVFDGLKLFSTCPLSYAFENILVFHAFSCDIFTYSCLCYMYRQWLPGHLQFLHQKPLGVTNAREFLSSSFLLSLLLENLCNEGFFFFFLSSSPSIKGHDWIDQISEKHSMDFFSLEHRGTFARSITYRAFIWVAEAGEEVTVVW